MEHTSQKLSIGSTIHKILGLENLQKQANKKETKLKKQFQFN